MEQSLKVLYDTTIALQNEKHSLSDFYADWVLAKIKLEKLTKKPDSSNIAKKLLEGIDLRKPQLFDKPMMLCAIILDPRFCTVLNNDQKKQAIDELNKLWPRIEAMRQRKDVIKNSTACASNDHETAVDDNTLLEEFVYGKAVELENGIGSSQNIENELEMFISAQKGFPKESTINFHISNKNKHPKLFELALVIFAVAPTQVVVERAFSVLSYVFNDRRNQLSSCMLEDILTICLNEDLFHIVNQKDMREIKSPFDFYNSFL